MKQNNVIDLSGYFLEMRQPNVVCTVKQRRARRTFRVLGEILETAASAAIALCVCVCTLLFFTIL